MQSYFFEVTDFRLINHEKLVAGMTIVINGIIEIHNCNLVYSPKSKSYRLCFPCSRYTDPETGKTRYYPQVHLSAVLQGKARAAAIEMYEDMRDDDPAEASRFRTARRSPPGSFHIRRSRFFPGKARKKVLRPFHSFARTGFGHFLSKKSIPYITSDLCLMATSAVDRTCLNSN